MSELLHSGHHPDADQLSAFAEQSLPEHERLITLAHLAECTDCRQVVFLAQQATQDEKLVPHSSPIRRPWFKSWNVLWPAVAAGLLIMTFMHGRKPGDLPQEATLVSKSPTPVVLPPPTLAPQSDAVARETSLKPLPKKPLPSTILKTAPALTTADAPSVKGDPFSSNRTPGNVRLKGRNTLAFTPQPADAVRAGAASIDGVGASSQGYQAVQLAPSQADSLATFRSQQQATLSSQTLSQQAAAPAPPSTGYSTQSFIPHSTTQTVEVTNAEPAIQTESAVLSAGALDSVPVSSQKVKNRSLPSKRLAVSSISNGSQTLAVDSAGDLFVSKDAGVNWQPIAQQWTGTAIKVTLASPAAKKRLDNSRAATSKETTSAASFGSISSAPSAKKVGFELSTDTGTTWFSPDGLVWEKR